MSTINRKSQSRQDHCLDDLQEHITTWSRQNHAINCAIFLDSGATNTILVWPCEDFDELAKLYEQDSLEWNGVKYKIVGYYNAENGKARTEFLKTESLDRFFERKGTLKNNPKFATHMLDRIAELEEIDKRVRKDNPHAYPAKPSYQSVSAKQRAKRERQKQKKAEIKASEKVGATLADALAQVMETGEEGATAVVTDGSTEEGRRRIQELKSAGDDVTEVKLKRTS